jgi:nicotinate-nucleotide adenylyltransferase
VKRFALVFILLGLLGCGHKPTLVLSVNEQFKVAKQYYDRNKYYKAQQEFEKLIYTYPGNTIIDTAQYYLSMSQYGQKDYIIAAGEFERLLASYPQSEFADDAQYQIGMCHYKMSPKYQLDQTETEQAIEAFQTFLGNFIGSPLAEDARNRIRELENKLAQKKFMTGLLYLKLGDYEPAMTYFWTVRDDFSSTDWAVQAIYYTGESLYGQKKYDRALETFQAFVAGFPSHPITAKLRKKTSVSQNNPKTYGILGGTFDPPHMGHLILAQSAYEALGLDQVIFIPTSIQPHKINKVGTPGDIRFKMLQLAIDNDPRFGISDVEIGRPGISYTVDTFAILRAQYPEDSLYLLMGSDNVVDIAVWKDPEQLFALCKVAAARRPDYNPTGPYANRVRYFEMPSIQLSSTLIRKKVKEGKSIKYLVPASVEDYILSNGLYRDRQ